METKVVADGGCFPSCLYLPKKQGIAGNHTLVIKQYMWNKTIKEQ